MQVPREIQERVNRTSKILLSAESYALRTRLALRNALDTSTSAEEMLAKAREEFDTAVAELRALEKTVPPTAKESGQSARG